MNALLSFRKEWLGADVVAGLTVAAVVIPKAMAYATVAGLPVQVGLYTAFLPMVIYALLGTSRPLSVSTTTTLAILAGADLAEVAGAGDPAATARAVATLTFLVGGILVVASILRLGVVASFISEPVLVGFKAGIGLVIVFDQVPKLLGLHIAKVGFLRDLVTLARALPGTSLVTLAVGIVMIVLLAGIEHLAPRAPAPLLAVAIGIAGTAWLGLQAMGVKTVGLVARGLPPLTAPDPSLFGPLWAGAIGIALMSFTETIAAGRAFVAEHEPQPVANRELLATGVANLGGAFFGAMPAGGGTTQTAVNRLAGARSQVSGLVTAAATLLVMLFLAPLIGLMPEATLAAVVIVYSIGLIRPDEFAAILKIRRMEFIWAVAALAGVVLLGTLRGIVVAIVVSLVALAYQAANPPVYVIGRKRGTDVFRPQSKEHPDDETFPGLLILRVEGGIFFGNVGTVGERIRALIVATKPRVVAFDLRAVPNLEYTALKALIATERRERERGVMVWLVGMTPEVFALVQRSPLGAVLGRERMFFKLENVVDRYLSPDRPAADPAAKGPKVT
ncbi:MAG TPA: SulP family inorganic anion transporter [Patescibacteria group bacterium]|nr:SulP family inorganic anion transporter [Patescibacteria group bacterium]